MNVLAVDTCSDCGSVALARENRLIEVVPLPAGWWSITLHQEIARLLGKHSLATRDIDLYGVTTGPGSFTGARMGLTAVKGLAEAHGKPIVPVSTLLTIAAAAQPIAEGSLLKQIVPLMDAHRGQIFGAVYQEREGWLTELVRESIGSLPSFLATLQNGNSLTKLSGGRELEFCGPDIASFLPEIEKAGFVDAAKLSVAPLLAGPLALIAIRGGRQGKGVGAADADANYVRPSDAELFWKE